MLEVHAPDAAMHTWKSIFIRIAAICVGLLIAVALEQSVEALHRHHEVAALRQDLHAESRQILYDARRAETAQVSATLGARSREPAIGPGVLATRLELSRMLLAIVA
jgi:type II secretory pathway component PulL